MQSNASPSRMSLRHKLILAHGAVTLGAILVAEMIALGVMALITGRPPVAESSGWATTILVMAIAALTGLLLGAWASRRLARRVQRALDISRAWLRGNLSLRIADPSGDDLGLLSEQLDLLAEHLEQDEQDLDTLRERNARLTDQVRALTVVEERNRLARELHDSVKQHLFSLAMTASGIRARFDTLPDVPDDLAEMVREVETTAQTAQREMTRLIEDLRPTPLREQGLAAALDDYTLLFGAREHLLIYLEMQGNDALLPAAVAEALYRVAQEALHNVARHARATRVDVHLLGEAAQVHVHAAHPPDQPPQPRGGADQLRPGRADLLGHQGRGAVLSAQGRRRRNDPQGHPRRQPGGGHAAPPHRPAADGRGHRAGAAPRSRRRADGTGSGGAAARRPGAEQRRDRRRAVHHRAHGQGARQQPAGQAAPFRSHPGGGVRLARGTDERVIRDQGSGIRDQGSGRCIPDH